MAKVRVYNDNRFEHRENFRGEMKIIPAGKFIEMEREDAVLFKSQFFQPKYDKGGLQDPTTYKMIRLEKIEEQAKDAEPEEFRCHACNFSSQTKQGLAAHVRAKHAGQMVDDEARKKLVEGL